VELRLREGMQIFVKTLTSKTPSPWQDSCISDQPPTTSLRLARQVWLQLVRGAQTHDSGITIDAHEGANPHVMRKQQLAAMQATCPGKSLNAGMTSRASITSLLPSTLPHTRLNPRHSSTLYDVHESRLRLERGKLGKHSGRLRQAQTTRGEGRSGGNGPNRPRDGFPDKASRLGFNAPRRTATYDGTCQLPNTVTLFYSPLCPSP
jgi:hypothetical protein